MSINLNNTTPAAPAGSTNVSFQRDTSGNVSAYITTPAELTGDSVDLTAQSADVPTATLEASPVAGLYRVSVYIVLTQAASVSSTLPAVVLQWGDQDTTGTVTINATATDTSNTVGTLAQATAVISSAAAATISYSTSGYASSGGTVMQFALHIRLEKI